MVSANLGWMNTPNALGSACDLGPLRYLTTLLGADSEAAWRWFVLVLALLLDPAAVPLLPAASV
jgi:hypothetical protein